MTIPRILLTAALLAPAWAWASNPPRSASSIGNAGNALGDQQQRLRQAHVKQLALGEEAEKLFHIFESLALEAVQAEEAQMKEIWESAEGTFRLEPNRADDAREVVEYYMEIFSLSQAVSQQEAALDALGAEQKGNKEKNKAIKKQRKAIKKNRKKISKFRTKIKDAIKNVLEYDKDGQQRQRLDNWLVVSTGLLRDSREEKVPADPPAQEKKTP